MASKAAALPAAHEEVIASESKSIMPPNVITMVLVDHQNSRTLEKRFEEVKSQQADALVEKLVHTKAVCTRLHDSVVLEALLPLVKQLKKGGTLSTSMSGKVIKMEEMLEKLENTKKHLSNKQFVQLMEEMRKACEEQFEEEEEVLRMMQDELADETLEIGATLMEATKMRCSLLPEKLMYA